MKLPVNYNELDPLMRREVREEYIRRQQGKCPFCRAPLVGLPATWVYEKPITPSLFPKGFFTYPVHLHHSHETGMTLGAVHALCNAVLWQHHGE